MALLDDEPRSTRLARAILSDISLFNEAAIRTATRDLTEVLVTEIAEGRALFASRVAPEFHGVFDRELDAWLQARRRLLANATPPRSAEEAYRRETARSHTVAPVDIAKPSITIVVAVAIVVLGLVGWILARP
jgi:hypothetical protein